MPSYEEKLKELGIDREAITKKCADPEKISICKEPTYLVPSRKGKIPNLGPKQKSPGLVQEDLSHLICAQGQKMRERNQRWWNSLTKEEQDDYTRRRKGKVKKKAAVSK